MPTAKIISITTRLPFSHPDAGGASEPSPDVMAVLRLLTSSATEHGADPQAIAHPDHELLGLCDQIVMLRKQEKELTEAWRKETIGSPARDAVYEQMKRTAQLVRRPLLRAGKLPATTAAGIYAKAVAVCCLGITTSSLGKSLADDLLACTQLRAALWPFTASC